MIENVVWNATGVVVKGDAHNVTSNTIFDGSDISPSHASHDRPRYQDHTRWTGRALRSTKCGCVVRCTMQGVVRCAACSTLSVSSCSSFDPFPLICLTAYGRIASSSSCLFCPASKLNNASVPSIIMGAGTKSYDPRANARTHVTGR